MEMGGPMAPKTTGRRNRDAGVASTGWLAAALVFGGTLTPLSSALAQEPAQKSAPTGQTADTSATTATPGPAAQAAKEARAETLPERADPKIAKVFEGAAAMRTLTLDSAAYADILAKYVEKRPGELTLFRYGAVTDADKQALKKQIADWQAIDETKLDRDQKFVFFVNLYNSLTLDVVLDHYPVKTIRDIKIKKPDQGLFASLSGAFTIGPWSDKLVTVNGTPLSLDDIEHSILRPMGDNRVHYAINCASVGCPDLKPTPFTVATLDEDLNAAATAYVGSKRGMNKSPATDGLLLSKIYSWFQVDFGGNEAGVVEHLRKYAPVKDKDLLKHTPRITGYRYDWSLNDAKTLG